MSLLFLFVFLSYSVSFTYGAVKVVMTFTNGYWLGKDININAQTCSDLQPGVCCRSASLARPYFQKVTISDLPKCSVSALWQQEPNAQISGCGGVLKQTYFTKPGQFGPLWTFQQPQTAITGANWIPLIDRISGAEMEAFLSGGVEGWVWPDIIHANGVAFTNQPSGGLIYSNAATGATFDMTQQADQPGEGNAITQTGGATLAKQALDDYDAIFSTFSYCLPDTSTNAAVLYGTGHPLELAAVGRVPANEIAPELLDRPSSYNTLLNSLVPSNQVPLGEEPLCQSSCGHPDWVDCGAVIDALEQEITMGGIRARSAFLNIVTTFEQAPDEGHINTYWWLPLSQFPLRRASSNRPGHCVLAIRLSGGHSDRASWASILASARQLNQYCARNRDKGGWQLTGETGFIEISIYEQGSPLDNPGHLGVSSAYPKNFFTWLMKRHQAILQNSDASSADQDNPMQQGSSRGVFFRTYCPPGDVLGCDSGWTCEEQAGSNFPVFFGTVGSALKAGLCAQLGG
ncbi:MAG: hypothetical protein M1827_007234 [Pycnora praestabilis]|nr:MAG: hypothetical protein M1827_007234 [Pycnora praestabilis]